MKHSVVNLQNSHYAAGRDILLLLFGSVISALAINVFYIPIRLTMGGVSGIVSIFYQLTGQGAFLPFGVLFMILNIPLLLIGYGILGWKFVWRSLVGTVVYSLVIDLSEPWLSGWSSRYIHQPLQSGSPDPLIYCLFGGILYGIGLGMILRARFTTGGTDILAILIHRRIKMLGIGQLLLVMDALIVLLSAIAYRHGEDPSLLLALYSFIAMYLTAKAIDVLLEGFDYCRTAYIISDQSDAIAAVILRQLERGVTALHGEGMYTGRDKKVLLCVLSRKQIPALKSLVAQIDPDAFVVVSEAREVLGEGFGAGHSF